MDTKNLKSISIAATIAIVAGVFMMGVNQAFGVDAPTQEPSTAGLVSPRFNGLEVQGEVTVDKRINVKDGLYNSAGGAVKIDDVEGLIVTGGINLSGKISNSAGGTPAPITLDDEVDIIGAITNSSKYIVDRVTKESPLTINDELSVTGKITGKADLDAVNITASKSLKANDLTTVDAIHAGGHIFLDFNALWLSDDSWIHQTVNGPLTIKSHAGRDLELSAGGGVDGAYMKLTKDGNISLKGNVLTEGKAIALNKSGESFIQGGSTLMLVGEPSGDIEMIAGNSRIWMKNAGETEVKGTLKVNGVAKATRFGTYSRVVSSTFSSIAANNVYEATAVCPAGTFIISCGGQGSDSTTYTATKWVTFSNLDPYIATNTCYARGVNSSNSTKYVRAIAICLNPAL